MKTKITFYLGIFIMVFAVFHGNTNAKAAEAKLDSTGTYQYSVNEDGTAIVLSYQKEEASVKIPSTLDGYVVTVIGKQAFAGKSSVTVVEIPDTVVEIKEEAFVNTGIKTIQIPESVRKIGKEAFGNCHKLTKLFIPKGVTELDAGVVNTSSKLTGIEVDADNEVYTSVDGILYSKDMTKLLEVPGGKDVSEFQFPDSVVYIGDEAFFWNDSLVEIDIPDRITYIGSGAFYDNSSLKRVVIGRGITKISDHAFYGCQILSKVVIAGKIQTIGESAFADCYKLVQINIPDGTTEIGDYAFYSCAHMPHIVIPESVTKIGARAFGCSDDGNYDVCIYSNQNTEAERYAINYALKFYNISGLGSGRMIRYDLLRVPQEKIKTLTTGKKQISLSYKKVEQASYRIAVKKAGTSTWKKYTASKASAVIKGLQSGKQYKVKVRAVQNITGIKAYGKWSAVKTVTVQ